MTSRRDFRETGKREDPQVLKKSKRDPRILLGATGCAPRMNATCSFPGMKKKIHALSSAARQKMDQDVTGAILP